MAFGEFDFRELAKNYPRGEKFLYSVFSRFATSETLEFFENIGVKTYMQDDMRFFPESNSAEEVRTKFLDSLKKCVFKNEKVLEISQNQNKFLINTSRGEHIFDKVVIAVGGHAGFNLAKMLGHKIIEPKPALTGLITAQNLKPIQGVSLKNVRAQYSCGKLNSTLTDDILFTHEGVSGPLAYKISSICAREDFSRENPLLIKLNLMSEGFLDLDSISFQDMLNSNSKKDIKNLISDFVPKSLAEYVLNALKIKLDEKCCNINGKTRDLILKTLKSFEFNVILPAKDGEVVTSGGVSLDEINPKTMESKLVKGLYFCGEVIDVDGFCGGFNLQNCWSTGFIAGNSL